MLKIDAADMAAFVAGDGTILREVLHPSQVSVDVPYSLAHALVRAGEASRPHVLLGSEVYYILSGAGIMHVEGEESEVSGGSVIYVPPGAVQHIENRGPDDLVFLCIVHPAWRADDEQVC